MKHNMPKIGIMSAMIQELNALCDNKKTCAEIGGKLYWSATVNGVNVIASCCGLGKVNATQVACNLLQTFDCQSILFCGIAGGLDLSLQIGDVVIADRIICHDYGVIEDNQFIACQPGSIPQKNCHADLAIVLEESLQEKIHDKSVFQQISHALENPMQAIVGTILSGDLFVNCSQTRNLLFQKYHAHAIDMESIAVAQTCRTFQKSWIVVRSLSDFAKIQNSQHCSHNFKKASHNAAQVAKQLIPLLLS